MTKRMLIDGSHAEETRVVVLDGNRLEEFDVETSTKKQLKGNIYLAKVVRVEPSLQAAFVEYGGNRHGFLAFGEIHPDYYQIPIADRERLIAQQEEDARRAAEAEEAEDEADSRRLAERAGGHANPARERKATSHHSAPADEDAFAAGDDPQPDVLPLPEAAETADMPAAEAAPAEDDLTGAAPRTPGPAQPAAIRAPRIAGAEVFETGAGQDPGGEEAEPGSATFDAETLGAFGLGTGPDGEIVGPAAAIDALADALAYRDDSPGAPETAPDGEPEPEPAPPPETIGGEQDEGAERERRIPPRFLRQYKIQDVIKRRQIMLIQVVKEERGGKGAALTTYISLAGRFCVLMPNSPRGGGVSRKITSVSDRRRLREITNEIGLPSGMGLIVRTAGAARPKPEIVRDCEYLLQLWDEIRETTFKSVAPALIYEEASLIKRAVRDLYSRDIDEVLVDGEAAFRAAREQMRMLMPSHASKVQLWNDPSGQKLFAKHQVEAQLDSMLSPTVQLKSGGYLVINQTEALVAIDVNSGRSTRERNIEETALRTNLEAAEEVARQLRLRDLAGLIVIDFIDMEARRHNAMVEKRLKDSLKSDRARIQLGSISHFGLMEMSRQRLRPSLAETSLVQCPHCNGTGHVRSTEGSALHVLRAIEEEAAKRRTAELMVHAAGAIAMYILNYKRDRLHEIETQYGLSVLFTPDPALIPPAFRLDKLRALTPAEIPALPAPAPIPERVFEPQYEDAAEDMDEDDGPEEAQDAAPGSPPQPASEGGRRRRRRRRRGNRRDDAPRTDQPSAPPETAILPALALPDAEQPDLSARFAEAGSGGLGTAEPPPAPEAALSRFDEPEAEPGFGAADGTADDEGEGRRRRGRRGGRRRRREFDAAPEAPPFVEPAYIGPTPADPFGNTFDIFDVLERAEAGYAAPAPAPMVTAPALPPEPEPAPAPAPPTLPEPAATLEPALPAAAPPEQDTGEPAASAPKRRAPRKRAKAKVEPDPVPEPAPAPEPTPEPVSEPAPVFESPPPEEPMIRPVLVNDAPPTPRRGWWRK